ncbi:MAG: diguanylate cyclase [Chloroflexia bacterium]
MVSPASSQPAMVLVVDADPSNQRALRDRLLRLGYTARSADDHQSAYTIVSSTPPDVLLLPGQADMDEGWRDLQQQLDNWGIPVLKLTAPSSDTSTQLIDMITSMSDSDLQMRVEGALRSRSLLKALAVENARLEAERLHDPLTGLFNRRYVMIRVEEEVRRSARHAYPLSCLIVDLDRFGDVNDAWGHMVGDSVLRDVAHIVTRTMRTTDIVCRYRDDEFLVLLTDTDAPGAQIAANRLRDGIAAHDFFNREGDDPIKITASIGIAYWEPMSGEGGTWEPQLLALAERALKAAKLSGPNRLVMLQAA